MKKFIHKSGRNEDYSITLEPVNFGLHEKYKAKRINEFKERNEKNFLQWCLGKYKGMLYWINLAETTKENEMELYKNSLICPYCLKPVTLIPEGIKRSHFRHKQDAEFNDCPYKIQLTEFYNKRGYSRLPESEKHKEIKEWCLVNLIGERIDIITERRIEYRNFESRIQDITERKLIVDIVMEKRVQTKNEESKGYQPDLLLILEDGSVCALEITVTSGKTVQEYQDVWNRWGHPVYEIREGGEYGFKATNGNPRVKLIYDPNFKRTDELRRDVDIQLNKIKGLEEIKDKIYNDDLKKSFQRTINYEYYLIDKLINEEECFE